MKTIGTLKPGEMIFVQDCRKCGVRQKSNINRVLCQIENCNGAMTADLNMGNYNDIGEHYES